MNTNIDTQVIIRHEIQNYPIKMYEDPEVWAPYSAIEALSFLYQNEYLSNLEDKSLLDIGTGSGIMGIFCGLLGAKNVILSDYSQSAVDLAIENAKLNDLQVAGIQSDCFKAFENQTFDFIISNPPVQPWLYTNLEDLEHRKDGATWNEAGADGRLVLDALLKEGKNYLTPNGEMIFSCSTRHGHQKTIQLLNEYWEDSWEIIYSSEHHLDLNYHGPYIQTWLHLQAEDLDLRIYQKDEQGKRFSLQEDSLITDINQLPVKIHPYNDSLNIKSSEGANLLPDMNQEKEWTYEYYLIRVRNIA